MPRLAARSATRMTGKRTCWNARLFINYRPTAPAFVASAICCSRCSLLCSRPQTDHPDRRHWRPHQTRHFIFVAYLLQKHAAIPARSFVTLTSLPEGPTPYPSYLAEHQAAKAALGTRAKMGAATSPPLVRSLSGSLISTTITMRGSLAGTKPANQAT